MDEIRKIRDENSERHLRMTSDERKREEKEVLEWFARLSGKPLILASPGEVTEAQLREVNISIRKQAQS
jgi:hypothetical protein